MKPIILLLLFILIPVISNGQIITSIAGKGTWSCSGDGGSATAAAIGQAYGIAIDTSGNVYVTSSTCSKIRKISLSGIITTVAGNGSIYFSGDGGPATNAAIGNPNALVVDRGGNLYISDDGNSVIRKVTPSGIISTIAGDASVIGGGYNGDGGLAVNALLMWPEDIVMDSIGNLYIADAGNNLIRKISPGGIITRVAGTGAFASSGDGGLAVSAAIQSPTSISIDNNGNIYIVEDINHKIRKISASGIITTIAGNGVMGYTGDGGPATAAQFYYPQCVRTDNYGNVFIADSKNNVVRKIDTFGNIATVVGDGSAGYSGDGGPATAAALSYPESIAIAKNGYLYVSELNGARARKIDTCLVPHIGPITGGATICLGGSISLSDSVSGGIWSSSTPSVANIGPSGNVTGSSTGLAVISYSVTNGCATQYVSQTIIVGPYAGMISGYNHICPGWPTNLTSDVHGGVWSSSDTSVVIISATGLAHGVNIGTSTISYIVSDVCGTDTSTYIINDSCFAIHVNETITENSISVYPNPATTNITISSSTKITSITITNLLGQTIYTNDHNSDKVEIDVNHLTPGIYLIKINGSEIRKFIKN